MTESLTFDDVLLQPVPFSTIASRKDVDTTTELCGITYKMGILSSNMNCVYSSKLSQEVLRMGGVSVVPRFYSIEDNIKMFKDGIYNGKLPWVSVGIGSFELERTLALVSAGADTLTLDVANGASETVLNQIKTLRHNLGYNISIMVGNFATKEQIETMNYHLGDSQAIDLYKVSIGSGSACTTSTVTGVGVRSFSSLKSCLLATNRVIFDGGIKVSGDYAKCLALGAKGVMMGRNFAATLESPAEQFWCANGTTMNYSEVKSKLESYNQFVSSKDDKALLHQMPPCTHKLYSGSASLESYKQQNKVATHRSPEGESFLVPVTGTVEELMVQFDGGLRSSMSYLNSRNLEEFKKNAVFVRVTNSGIKESLAHGKE